MTQLSLIRQGGLLADVDEALRELVRTVCYMGKAGTVTVKISVKPATKNSDEISLKTPSLPTPETILFSTDDGELCESDPRQRNLDFGKVEPAQEAESHPDHFQKVN